MGVFTFAGPLLVLPFSKSLVPVVATLVVGRIVACAAHLLVCLRVLPELGRAITWERGALGPLLRYGGWMTVTNVVGPLMVTLDRFLIGALVSMTAVTYYATPYEIVTAGLLLPGALMGVMFPAFSAGFEHNRERTALLFGRSVKLILLVLFPVMLCTIALAQDGLRLWLGAEFAQHSYRVYQWLAVGVFINSVAFAGWGSRARRREAGSNRNAASDPASSISRPALVADWHSRDRGSGHRLDLACVRSGTLC